MNTRWTRAVTALALGGGLALAAPALPAVGDHSPPTFAPHDIEVGDEATVIAKGAGVIVPVEVTCEAGRTGFVHVEITQARGRHVANGFGFTEVDCEGTTQTVNVVVTADGGAFKRGPALVRAHLGVCAEEDFFSPCDSDMDVEEITATVARP